MAAHGRWLTSDLFCRDKLREQNALSEEIVNAITSNQIGEQIDEDDLEAELDQLQQEQLDEQMLKTGSVPVSDQIHRTPAVPAGDSECMSCAFGGIELTPSNSQGQSTCRGRGRRRGGAAQVAGRDGHVNSSWNCKRNYIVQRESAPMADEGGRFCSVVSA